MVSRIAALAGVFLLAALVAPAPVTGGERAPFCPACEQFTSGDCSDCGRPPVFLEVRPQNWFWCASASTWREEACPADAAWACCTEHAGLAMAADPSVTPVVSGRWCPACRRTVRDADCALCGREALITALALPAWTWCSRSERWESTPCSASADKGCCETFSPVMPAWVPRPMPHPVAFRPSAEPGALVSTDWLEAHLDDPGLVVVHVGAPPDDVGRSAFADGHVPFARPMGWGEIAINRDGLPNEFPPAEQLTASIRRLGVDEGSRIVLYDTGAGLEAARAFVAFEYVGLRPSLLDGHWAKWRREGREVSTARASTEDSGFRAVPRSGVVADLRMVEDCAWACLRPEGGVVLIDARPFEEYIGLRAGEGVPRPGARNLPWSSVYRSGTEPVFRSEAELRELFESKGARPGVRVIVYCRTGTEAGPVYVAARLLGLETSLYDGSFVEWSSTPGLPVGDRFASYEDRGF